MTTSLSQTVLMNDITPVRLVSLSNVSGTYNNGPYNNGIGATLTVAASSLTIDGSLVAVGDRVLLKNQTNSYENGIYICSSISTTVVLKRAADQQNIEQLKAGQFIFVGDGYNASTVFVLCNPLPQVIGTSAFTYKSSSILKAQVNISATDFLGMYAAPKLIIPAPGANSLIVVDHAELIMTYGSIQFTLGGIVSFQYDNTIHGGGPKATSTEASADFIGASASSAFLFNRAAGDGTEITLASTVNKGLYLSNQTQAFATGDSTFVAKVNYRILATA